jgi:hypothetical protein
MARVTLEGEEAARAEGHGRRGYAVREVVPASNSGL